MPFVGENHGTEGPVRTSFNDWELPIGESIIRGCDEVAGYMKKPTDLFSGDHIGFYNTMGIVARAGPDKGMRSYAARCCYQANECRLNLKVPGEAHVAKVVLKQGDEEMKATGVRFSFNRNEHTIVRFKEVILCASIIQSPQLLELSGIGDYNVLEAAGLEWIVSLPAVGNNSQDHVITSAIYELTDGIISLDALHAPEVMADAIKRLEGARSGQLTCISSVKGYWPHKLFATESELDATTKYIQDSFTTTTPFQRKQLEPVIRHLGDGKLGNMQFVLIPTTVNLECWEDQSQLFRPPAPVHIAFSDPAVAPALDPAYLKHLADVFALASTLKFADAVAHSKALEGEIGKRIFPEPDVDLQDAEQRKEAVKDWCMGDYHPAGTCTMGDVVDARLRVIGMEGLRDFDANIFSNHVSGNIVGSVYAVAEKASDIMRKEYVVLFLEF